MYNTTRQVGSVLGAAAIAVLIEARMAHHLAGAAGPGAGHGEAMGASGAPVPPQLADAVSAALRESLYLPAALLLLGAVAAFFLVAHSDQEQS